MKRLCKGLTTLGAETVLCIALWEGLATEFEGYHSCPAFLSEAMCRG